MTAAANQLDDLRRMLCQTLEHYRRLGIEQMPLVVPSAPVAAAAPSPAGGTGSQMRPNTPPRSASAGGGTAPWMQPRRPAPPSSEIASVASANSSSSPIPGKQAGDNIHPTESMPRKPSLPAASTTPPRAVNSPAPFPSTATREERTAALVVIDQQVKACTRCQELASTRNNTVFGTGDAAAKIMFIGEAPGADEDEQGIPFVGRAGQLLTDIITAIQLTRSEIYICNILKCRPPGNRTPTETECQSCREYLNAQLAIINPEYIVCWGTTAAQNVLNTKQTIGKLRQQFFRVGMAKVLCTYHPSYLLRNPAAKKDVWEDMKFWRLEMGVDLSQVRKKE